MGKQDYKCRLEQGPYNFYILVQMLSTSKLAPFSLTSTKPNDKLFKKHKFTPHVVSPFDHYRQQLCSNVTELKIKYPLVDPDYIRNLLEELENNVEMVSDILDEEQKKHLKTSMEDERSENELSLFDLKKEKLELPKTQDLKVLRLSLAKLFKMFTEERSVKEEALKKMEAMGKEIENLKLMNRQLLNEQMQQSSLTRNEDIY